MLKKNRKSIIKKLALMLFIVLGLTIGSTFVAAHDTVVDPGYDKNVIGNNITDVTGNAWATISVVVMTLAIGCIVITGLRYMLSSSDRKADIKQSSAYIVIGCVLIFATMPIINLVTNTFKDVTSVQVLYDSTDKKYKGDKMIETVSVTSDKVAPSAFENCTSLRTVVFEEGVTTIGNEAFKNCKNLEIIILPSTIKTVGKSAFEGCVSAKEIIIKSKEKATTKTVNGVKAYVEGVQILDRAFYGCENVQKFGVGDYIVFASIGKSAFENCKNLLNISRYTVDFTGKQKSLEFSGSLNGLNIISSIGENAFNGTALKSLYVGTLNSYGEKNTTIAGVTETVTGKTHLTINKIGGVIKTIEVNGDSKVTFAKDSFKDSKYIENVVVNNKCDVTFGESSFSVSSFDDINVYNSIENVTIGDGCNVIFGGSSFAGSLIQSLVIGNNISNITFMENSFKLAGTMENSIANIPGFTVKLGKANSEVESKIDIANNAFIGSFIKSLEIGNGYDNIIFGENAFSEFEDDKGNAAGCYYLTNVNIGAASNIVFGKNCFKFAGTLTEDSVFTVNIGNRKGLTYSSTVPTISIGANAFLESNVSQFSLGAFHNISIGDAAFDSSTSLKSFIVPIEFDANGPSKYSKISSMGQWAFKDCTNLITFGDATTKAVYLDIYRIRASSFIRCGKLNTFAIYAPSKTIVIGESAFQECTEFNASNMIKNTKLGNIEKNAFNSTATNGNITTYGNSIGDSAFVNTKITSVKLLKEIDPNADNEDKEFTIGSNAFKLTPIESIKYTQGMVFDIGASAFSNCSNFLLFVPTTYTNNANGTMDFSFVNIGESAFCGCGGIPSLNLDKKFTLIITAAGAQSIIHNDAFRVSSVASVTLHAGTFKEDKDQLNIGQSAFYMCRKLESVYLSDSKINTIGDNAFAECLNLKEVYGYDDPEAEVRTIGQSAFMGANNGLSFYGIKTNKIGNTAFKNVTISGPFKISAISATDTCTIQKNAFQNVKYGNTDLDTIITFGSGKFEIQGYAFQDATIDYISVGNETVFTTIYADAFASCDIVDFIDSKKANKDDWDAPAYIKCGTVEASAFNGAEYLKHLYLSSIDSISTLTVGNMSANLNDTIFNTSAEDYDLGELKFRGHVNIGVGAFANMSSLKAISFEGLPNSEGGYSQSFVEISKNAFYNCTSLYIAGIRVSNSNSTVRFTKFGEGSFSGDRAFEGFYKTTSKDRIVFDSDKKTVTFNGSMDTAPLLMDQDSLIDYEAFKDTAIKSIYLKAIGGNAKVTINAAYMPTDQTIKFETDGTNKGTDKNPTFTVNMKTGNGNDYSGEAFKIRGTGNIKIGPNVCIKFGSQALNGNGSNSLDIKSDSSSIYSYYGKSYAGHPSFRGWKKVTLDSKDIGGPWN